jgi:hypothetical protein
VNIIFLDIDGVLNSGEYMYRRRLQGSTRSNKAIDPECVNVLNEIVQKTRAHIVVSSSWRIGRTLQQLQRMLYNGGVVGNVLGVTPMPGRFEGWHGGMGYFRGDEIQAWIDQHFVSLQLKHIVILDDDSDMKHLTPWLVKTRWDEGGLQAHHLPLALDVLASPFPGSVTQLLSEGLPRSAR